MGKPYKDEISYLPQSIFWAASQNIDLLKRVVQGNSAHQLTPIGSGGSFTAAAFLAQLHEGCFGNISRAITPLEFLSQRARPQSNRTLAFISAEGKNKDILAAADAALSSQCPAFVITLTSDNPLGKVCDVTGLATVASYDMPWIKDGYLATNSLIAMMVLIARAYRTNDDELKLQLAEISDQWIETRRRQLRDNCEIQKLHASKPVIILYGQTGHIAAIDLESKLAEASLAVCQVCDYRQFAHGRHLQLSSPDTPLIIAFSSPQDKLLSAKTIALFPSGVPVVEIQLPERPDIAEIMGTIEAMLLTEIIGVLREIDPGQPNILSFGREIYGLDVNELVSDKFAPDGVPAVKIKIGNSNATSIEKCAASGLEFCKQLESARFRAIVCDFDGTFCDTAKRYDGIDDKLVPELERLLSSGIPVGFATGRGDSLHKELRERITDSSLWPEVLLGLYSGSYILSLDSPVPIFQGDNRFHELVDWLDYIGLLQQLATKPKICGGQMGLRITDHTARLRALAAIHYWIKLKDRTGWRAYCSSHSIDVITEDTGKANVVGAIAKQTGYDPQTEILRIGDSGDFDGNDFELLNDGLSLSVCSASPLPDSCWNLLPKECHGHIGTLYYLSSLEVAGGRASFSRDFIKRAKELFRVTS